MLLFATLILIALLVGIIIQDIKYRAIHFLLPVGVFVVGLFRFFFLKNNYIELLLSLGFLAAVLVGLFIYLSIKLKKWINPINQFIGIGDIVFFIAVIPFFYKTTYILFFSSGMFFALVCHAVLTKDKERHVPLAGYLSLYLLGLLLVDFCIEKELFYTAYLF